MPSCSPAAASKNEQPQAALDVADHRECAAPGVGQEPPGQSRLERPGRDLVADGGDQVGEVVEPGGSRAVAGEVERDQAAEVGPLGHVVGREVVLGRDRLAGGPAERARPFAAEQGPLVTGLPRVVGEELHAVAGGE